ncbi:MAG: peptidylprolyl isomerase, partial [Pseudomonas sp.]
MLKKLALAASALLFAAHLLAAPASETAAPHVLLSTSLGEIEIELEAAKAPISVKNFLAYVDSGFYNGTQFHR